MVASFGEPTVNSAPATINKPVRGASAMPCQPKPATSISSTSTTKNQRLRWTPVSRTPKQKNDSATAEAWARMAFDLGVSTSTNRSNSVKSFIDAITYRTSCNIEGLSAPSFLPMDVTATIMDKMDAHTLLKSINNSNVARAIFELYPRSYILSSLRSAWHPARQLTLGLMLLRQAQAQQCIKVWKLKPYIWSKIMLDLKNDGPTIVDPILWASLELNEYNNTKHIRRVVLGKYVSTYLGDDKSPEAALAMLRQIVTILPMIISKSSPYYTVQIIGVTKTAVPVYEVPGVAPIGFDEIEKQYNKVKRLTESNLYMRYRTPWETE